MKNCLMKKFWWPGINGNINKWINKCEECAKCGTRKKNKNVVAKKEYELWEMDLIGHLQETDEGNKYILTKLIVF